MKEQELKVTTALFRRGNHQLTERFERESPKEAQRAGRHLWAAEHSTFKARRSGKPKILEGVALYGKLLNARLKECGKVQPDWRLALQQTLWIKQLEQNVARRHKELYRR
jgi:hypothetical protein